MESLSDKRSLLIFDLITIAKGRGFDPEVVRLLAHAQNDSYPTPLSNEAVEAVLDSSNRYPIHDYSTRKSRMQVKQDFKDAEELALLESFRTKLEGINRVLKSDVMEHLFPGVPVWSPYQQSVGKQVLQRLGYKNRKRRDPVTRKFIWGYEKMAIPR